MNLNEFIQKSKRFTNEGKEENLNLGSSTITLPSIATASTDTKLNQLSFNSSKSSIEVKNAEELLSEIKKNIREVQDSERFIRNLAQIKTCNLIQNSSQKFVLRLPKYKFNYKKVQVEFTFRSAKNDITHEIWQVKTMRSRKNNESKTFTEPTEDINTVIQAFLDKNVPFKPSGKRSSISTITRSSIFGPEKTRQRNASLFNPNLKEIIDSESSSSSSSEEDPLPKYYLSRQALYKETLSDHRCHCEGNFQPIDKKDYKKKAPKSSAFINPTKNWNKNALKFGYLTKRMSKTNKFHKRWVVLTGFKLRWYRNHSTRFTKGMINLSQTLVSLSEAGKEKCILIVGKERVVEFLNDQAGTEWRHLINSQICYKGYLDQFEDKDPGLLEYFQDINAPSLVLENIEFTDGLFFYFSNALPAHTHLETLKLSACILGDDHTSKLCEFLKGNCYIKSLDLSNNQLTCQCVSSIAALIKQEEAEFNTIMHLNLSENPNIKDEGVEQLAGAFNVRFEHLFLPNILHQLPFYSLRLNNIGMGDRGLNALNKIFMKTQKLLGDEEIELKLSLEIGRNWFTSVSFSGFAENISQFQGIENLNISECYSLRDEDVVLLAETLIGNFSITDLDISKIPITRFGYEKLFTLFAQNFVLRNLKVQIDDEFKIAIIEKGNVLKNFMIVN